MHTFEVEINWQGTTVKESIQATSPAMAKSAVLARHSNGTLWQIVRVG